MGEYQASSHLMMGWLGARLWVQVVIHIQVYCVIGIGLSDCPNLAFSTSASAFRHRLPVGLASREKKSGRMDACTNGKYRHPLVFIRQRSPNALHPNAVVDDPSGNRNRSSYCVLELNADQKTTCRNWQSRIFRYAVVPESNRRLSCRSDRNLRRGICAFTMLKHKV